MGRTIVYLAHAKLRCRPPLANLEESDAQRYERLKEISKSHLLTLSQYLLRQGHAQVVVEFIASYGMQRETFPWGLRGLVGLDCLLTRNRSAFNELCASGSRHLSEKTRDDTIRYLYELNFNRYYEFQAVKASIVAIKFFFDDECAFSPMAWEPPNISEMPSQELMELTLTAQSSEISYCIEHCFIELFRRRDFSNFVKFCKNVHQTLKIKKSFDDFFGEVIISKVQAAMIALPLVPPYASKADVLRPWLATLEFIGQTHDSKNYVDNLREDLLMSCIDSLFPVTVKDAKDKKAFELNHGKLLTTLFYCFSRFSRESTSDFVRNSIDILIKKEGGELKEFGTNCMVAHLSSNAALRESLEKAYTSLLRDYEREFFLLTVGPKFSPFVQKNQDGSMDLDPLIREMERRVNALAKERMNRTA